MDDDEAAAAALLRSRGYSVTMSKRETLRRGMDEQRLWVCHWGTMTALVWARTAENATLRVRHQCFDRAAGLHDITRRQVVVHGDVTAREATAEDMRIYEEAGGKVPA